MPATDFTTTIEFDQSPAIVFDAINNVRGWWSEDFTGSSDKLNDEFGVRFGDMHYSWHRLTEFVPGKKITWLVAGSYLSFLDNKYEWTGTENIFEIEVKDGKTQLRFTHKGLVPGIECFEDCNKGWNHYLRSLANLITTGEGQPNKK